MRKEKKEEAREKNVLPRRSEKKNQ